MSSKYSRTPLSCILGLLAVAPVSCGKDTSQNAVTGYTKIDDMEGEGGRIGWSPTEGWPSGQQAGFWSSSTDCTEKDRILPVPYFVDPFGWRYESVPRPYPTMPGVTSTSAVRLRTQSGKSLEAVWGANVGFDFAESSDLDGAAPWPPATSVDAGVSSIGEPCTNGSSRDFNGVPVDLSKYSGLTFWAMAWPGGRQSIRVQINDRHTDPRENYCSPSRSTDEHSCYDSFGKSFMLTDTFTQYSLDFSELRQDGWGYRAGLEPLDRGNVYSLNFLVPLPGCTEDTKANCAGEPVPVAFDVWIDDLYFVNRP
jgi:hypothetical protein